MSVTKKVAPHPSFRLSRAEARRVVLAAQGLAGAVPSGVDAAVEGILEKFGFVRTLGGVDVYFALRARAPKLTRAAIDAAVEARRAQVVPAVRGCIYLVAARDVAISLRFADGLSAARAAREQEKAGIRKGEVERVAKAALDTLRARGAMTPDALRRALPEGVLRPLGEAGKKLGISSALPGALRRLEFAGEVERTLEGGRLDSERYAWRVAARNPRTAATELDDPAEVRARIASIFFRSAGIGTVTQLAAWAGIAQRDAKAACERLDLAPVEVEGAAALHFVAPEHRALLAKPPAADGVAFLPFEDNALALHGGASFLVDAVHHGRQVPSWGSGRPQRLVEAQHLSFRSFVAGDAVAGFWEWDPETQEVVLAWLGKPGAATKKRVAAAAEATGAFIENELGHGRSFSLDTDEELRRRATQLRKMKA